MINQQNVLSNFTLTQVAMLTDDILSFTLKNPLLTDHLSNNTMVVKGSLTITIDDYIKVSNLGDDAKYCPRLGQTPFVSGTVVNMKATEPSIYLCVVDNLGGKLNYESIVYETPLTPAVGTLAVPTEDYLLNGIQNAAGTPVVIKAGDTISTTPGVKIGLFTVV
jgi:hypothetical protein